MQACTFTIANNAANVSAYITDKNVGAIAPEGTFTSNKSGQATFIEKASVNTFEPSGKHFYIYLKPKASPVYYLVKEVNSTRCGKSTTENTLLISEIINGKIQQKQPGRFVITTHNTTIVPLITWTIIEEQPITSSPILRTR